MKYACGAVGSIRNTVTGCPFVPGLDSVPVRPSNGWPDVDTLPGYRNPSMWSNDLFSSIRSTTLFTAARPVPLAIFRPLHSPKSDETLPGPHLGIAPAAAALGGQPD